MGRKKSSYENELITTGHRYPRWFVDALRALSKKSGTAARQLVMTAVTEKYGFKKPEDK